MNDVTEFTYLDPLELHLVGAGANGFAPLLAKSVAEAIDAETADRDVKSILKEAGVFEKLCGCDPCNEVLNKAKLKAKQRNALSDSDFAIPEDRAYPIHDESHARNALSRVSANGTPDEKKRVRAAVHRKYPNIGKEDAEKAMQTQDQYESTESPTVSTSESQGQSAEVHAGREMGAVTTPGGMTSDRPSGAPQHLAAENKPVDMHEGHGDLAPDKSIPMGEAQSQAATLKETMAPGGEGDGRGDTAPDKNLPKDEAESQTEAVSRKAEMDNPKGGDKDDDDADDKMTKAATELSRAVTLIEAKKDIGEINSAISQATSLLSGLVEGINQSQVANKEILDMTSDELIKLLDERDAAKEAKKEAEKDAAAKEAPVVEAEVAKATPEEEVAKAAPETAEDKIAVLEKQVAEMRELLEKQPAGRPMLNATGVEAGAQAPTVRGQETGGGFFKSLEDKIANAPDARTRQRFATELLKAKAISSERTRVVDPRQPVALLGQPAEAVANASADR